MRPLLHVLAALLVLPVAVVGTVALLVVIVRVGPPRSVGEALFLLPALLGIGLAAWPLATDPRLRAAADAVR